MPIYIQTVDGRTHALRNQKGADDESELKRLLDLTVPPYSLGWVEIDTEPALYIALRHIIGVGIRRNGELV